MTQIIPQKQGIYDLSAIDQADLSPNTAYRYKLALKRYLDTGNDLTNTSALTDFASDLPHSVRSQLKAAIKIITEDVANNLKSVANPDNLANIQSALYRIESMQNSIRIRKHDTSKKHNWVSRKQVIRLLDTCSGYGVINRRNWLVLAILISTGIRRNELCDLRFCDLTTKGDRWVIHIQAGKGDKSRSIPIQNKLALKIKDWQKIVPNKNGHIIRSVDKAGNISENRLSGQAIHTIVSQAGKAIGIPDLSPHDLRRSFGQIGIDNGISIQQLKVLYGHKQITTTIKYLNLELDLDTSVCDFVPI